MVAAAGDRDGNSTSHMGSALRRRKTELDVLVVADRTTVCDVTGGRADGHGASVAMVRPAVDDGAAAGNRRGG